MSAIAGILQLDSSPLQTVSIQRMVDILAHRGSDGAGVWLDGGVGLGHRMLWTTPESLAEKLPLQIGHNTITADARIDNRDELLRQLNFGGRPASEIADSEIILASYEKWGEDCPGKLIGDFAFAIWDEREDKLFCARDYFGVKPFYYYHVPHRIFAFASEIKALLCLPDVPQEMNEVMIADYLSLEFEDKTITFYKDIVRLPPAHKLIVTSNSVRLAPYWQLDPEYELRLRSDDEYVEQYRELFARVMESRLRSAFPIGTALSGGLDSSSIACVARDIHRQKNKGAVLTFSMIFDEATASDERPYINAVLEQGGFEPHYVLGDQIRPYVDFERTLWHQDGVPFFAPQYFLHWGMWDSAKQRGVRIFLDGLIGDNTVSNGAGYWYEMARGWHWIKLAQELRGTRQQDKSIPIWKIWRSLVKQQGIKPYVPESVLRIYRQILRHQVTASPVWKPHTMLQPGFVQRIDLEERMRLFPEDDENSYRTERQLHYRMLTLGLLPYAFELADKGSAALGIEARYPFTDRRLAEFCLALPGRMKLHHGYGRMIARRGLAHTLPEKIQWRNNKGNLAPTLARNFLLYERERIEQTLHSPLEITTNYLNVADLQKTYKRYANQEPGDYLRPFWAAVMFDQAFRRQQEFAASINRKEVIAADSKQVRSTIL